jgi:hypothetical protein
MEKSLCYLFVRLVVEKVLNNQEYWCYTVPRHELDFSQEGEKVGK